MIIPIKQLIQDDAIRRIEKGFEKTIKESMQLCPM